MKEQRVLAIARAVLGAAMLASLAGCGGALYAVQANAAANRLEEAKAEEADRLAPYEYYYAREHLTKAMEEASQGDYGDAIDLAEIAEEYAEKASKLAKQARRGAGR